MRGNDLSTQSSQEVTSFDEKVREAAVLSFANRMEQCARTSRALPPKWQDPSLLLRPLLDALGAISIGFVAANISILLIFIVVNILLHL